MRLFGLGLVWHYARGRSLAPKFIGWCDMSGEMYVIEGARAAREGEILPYSVTWAGFTTVSSALTTAYRDGVDVSATVLTGSEVTSGNVQ